MKIWNHIQMGGKEYLKDCKAEPVTVMVVKRVPKECRKCDFSIYEWLPETGKDELVCLNGWKPVPRKGISDSCEMRKAIGIVEPGYHIRYFGEERKHE